MSMFMLTRDITDADKTILNLLKPGLLDNKRSELLEYLLFLVDAIANTPTRIQIEQSFL